MQWLGMPSGLIYQRRRKIALRDIPIPNRDCQLLESRDILGYPEIGSRNMSVSIKSPQEIEKMRVSGRLTSEVLDYITPYVKAGVTTNELDKLCHDLIVDVQKAIPAPLDYAPSGHAPYPKSICTSINHQVCHGVPSDKKLKNGDIVNLDITVIKDGYHGDSSRMFYVGEPSIQARRLCEVTWQAMWRGIRTGRAHIWATLAMPSRASSNRWVIAWCASSAGTASDSVSMRNHRYCITAARRPA
jgi:hypothetical protein